MKKPERNRPRDPQYASHFCLERLRVHRKIDRLSPTNLVVQLFDFPFHSSYLSRSPRAENTRKLRFVRQVSGGHRAPSRRLRPPGSISPVPACSIGAGAPRLYPSLAASTRGASAPRRGVAKREGHRPPPRPWHAVREGLSKRALVTAAATGPVDVQLYAGLCLEHDVVPTNARGVEPRPSDLALLRSLSGGSTGRWRARAGSSRMLVAPRVGPGVR